MERQPKPWENSVFQVAVSLALTLICTVLGVRMKNLTWLLLAAWICVIPAVWIACKGQSNAASVIRTLFLLAVLGGVFLWADRKFPGQTEQSKVRPTISWSPSALKEGSPLGPEQLNARAWAKGRQVEGTFLYVPAQGDTPSAGSKTITVTFTPSDIDTYAPVTDAVVITVLDNPQLHQRRPERTASNPRTYMILPNMPEFAGGTLSAVGDPLAFNVHYTVSGPNSIEFVGGKNILYLASDSALQTQKDMEKNFTNDLANELRSHPRSDFTTLYPGESKYSTAFLVRDGKSPVPATQQDLNDLRTGAKLAFVFSEFIYRDQGVLHHTRKCSKLLPPAMMPGVWQDCDVYKKSD